jgi:hypothetical protein
MIWIYDYVWVPVTFPNLFAETFIFDISSAVSRKKVMLTLVKKNRTKTGVPKPTWAPEYVHVCVYINN